MKLLFLCSSFIMTIASAPAWALTILSPRSGEQILPGQSVWLIVQSEGEIEADVRTVEILAPGTTGCEKVLPLPLIQCELTVLDNPDKIFPAIDIRIRTTLGNDSERRALTYINISKTQPFNALWSGLGGPLIFDFVGQKKLLNAFGTTIDGIKHRLVDGYQGTVYTVDHPGIIKIQSDGSLVSQEVGMATITVQNGDIKLEIPVVVKVGKQSLKNEGLIK